MASLFLSAREQLTRSTSRSRTPRAKRKDHSMRKRLILGATLAVAVIGIGASSASAATLYTTSAHTTAVAVGTTFTASTPTTAGFNYTWSWALEVWERCNNASYTFKVTKNSAGVFKAEATSAAFNLCEHFPLHQTAGNGTLEINGSSITVGTGKAWLGSSLKEVNIESTSPKFLATGTLTSAKGNPPEKGVSAQQPAAGAPVSVVLSNAGTLESGFSGALVNANYTLTGAAASYSLG